MLYRLVAVMGLGLVATASWAAPDPAVAPDYAALCTGDGGFGYRFGDAPPPPGPISLPNTSHVTLDPRFAPFAEADVGATYWSRRVYGIAAEAPMTDGPAAAALAADIRRSYEAQGWLARAQGEDGNINLYSEAGGLNAQAPTGTRVELMRSGRTLVLTCISASGYTTHFAEIRNGPPVGRVRPQPPARPQLPAIDAAQCDDPARQQAVAARPEELVGPVMAWGNAMGRYQEELMAWKANRFIAAGRWTRTQAGDFALGLLRNRALGESMMRSSGLLQELMLTVAASRETPRETCQMVVRLEALMRRVAAHVEDQWRLMEAAYDAEARRLGVNVQ